MTSTTAQTANAIPETKEDMIVHLPVPSWRPSHGMAIGALRPMMTGLDVEAIILQFLGKTNDIYHFLIADRTGCISLWLWGDMGRAFKPMQTIRLTGGYTKLYRNSISVYIKRDGGRIQRTGEFRMLFTKEPNLSEFEWVQDPEDTTHYIAVKSGMARHYARLAGAPSSAPVSPVLALPSQAASQPGAVAGVSFHLAPMAAGHPGPGHAAGHLQPGHVHPMPIHAQPPMPMPMPMNTQPQMPMPMTAQPQMPMSMFPHPPPFMTHPLHPMPTLTPAPGPGLQSTDLQNQLSEQLQLFMNQREGLPLDPHSQMLVQQVQHYLSSAAGPATANSSLPALPIPSFHAQLQPAWSMPPQQQQEVPTAQPQWTMAEQPVVNEPRYAPVPDETATTSHAKKRKKEDSQEDNNRQMKPQAKQDEPSRGRGRGRGRGAGLKQRGRGRGRGGRGGQVAAAGRGQGSSSSVQGSRTVNAYTDLDYTASGGGDEFAYE